MEENHIQQAIADLRNGKLIAFPTETVYGLGALLSCEPAIYKLFEIKKRACNKPLALYFHSVEDACQFVETNASSQHLAKAFLPGPLTMVLKGKKPLSYLVTSDCDKVAIRIPSHPCAKALLTALNEPLVATSANLSGGPPALTAQEVKETFGSQITCILETTEPLTHTPSTIVSLYNEPISILREGSITKEALEKVLARS